MKYEHRLVTHISCVTYVHGFQIVDMKTERDSEIKAVNSNEEEMYVRVNCHYAQKEISKLHN
jgi:hypothetical protein